MRIQAVEKGLTTRESILEAQHWWPGCVFTSVLTARGLATSGDAIDCSPNPLYPLAALMNVVLPTTVQSCRLLAKR